MVTFNDIQNHWAKAAIEKLSDQGVISGYAEGSFKPDAPVTRAEFAALLRKAFPTQTPSRDALKFNDVADTYWAAAAIDYAYRTGFLSGYPGNLFKPEEKIPRVQAWVALSNGLKYLPTLSPGDTLKLVFDDSKDIPEYALNGIAAAAEKGLVVNYPQVRTLNPNGLATRADVAAFLSQALLKAGETPTVPTAYIAKVTLPGVPQRSGEVRGIWLTDIDSEVLLSSDAIGNAIDLLASAKFNTLYPTVWNGSYTLYRSATLKRIIGEEIDPRLKSGILSDIVDQFNSKDTLSDIIDKAHKKSLTVIPWFEFGLLLQADSQLAAKRPKWLTSRQDGSQVVEGKTRLEDRYWLNPFHPQVQQFLLDLVVEVVKNYEVDGIQFDDHLGLSVEFGYDNFTQRLYQQENSGKLPPTDPKDANWMRWRANKITELMGRIFWVVKEYKPNCLVSLSPNRYAFAYNNYLTDWKRWEEYGYVEEIILQAYRDQPEKFISDLMQPEVQSALRHIPVSIGILTGLKDQSVAPEQIAAQIKAVRDNKFNGVSFFFYESWKIAAATAKGKEIFAALFQNAATRPNQPA